MEVVNNKILCCECGSLIDQNPSNTCAACLSKRLDITNEIQKEGVLRWCSKCERYFQPPNNWYVCPPESKQLMALCLKKIKGLNKVRLADASFVWTEEHSRRIKLKLMIQKEVTSGAVLQQACFIEFIQQPCQCDDCARVEAQDYWRALVQVRQDAHSKKAIYFLEQEILKHKLHLKMSNIKEHHGGLDFFYAERNEARKLLDFVLAILPCRHHYAQELVSHDAHNNLFTYKHTYAVEIVPLCKDDVVLLPKRVAQKLGNLDQLCIVQRVSSSVHLICPLSGKIADVPASTYWREPFHSLYLPKDFQEFIVIDVEPIAAVNLHKGGNISKKHVLADVWVERSDEIGTGRTIHTRTHLGHLLNPGDTVQGLDLSRTNINNDIMELDNIAEKLPDVVLLKKVYQHAKKHRRGRGGGKSVTHATETASQMNVGSAPPSDDEDEDDEQESGKLVELFSSMFIQGNANKAATSGDGAGEMAAADAGNEDEGMIDEEMDDDIDE